MKYIHSSFAILCLALLVSGCSGSGPTTYPVKGKVTIDGKPLGDGINVSFVPDNADNLTAGGQAAADGSYTLYSGSDGHQGAMVGKYKVYLSDSSDTSYMDQQTATDPTKNKGRIPADYKPLEVEVTAGENTIDITL